MDFSNETLLRIPLSLVVFILSLSVHEWAHARVAFWFGDDTAARQGRLTLNPISHIDPIGTILMPIVGALSGWAVIGWAKPVPVNPARMTRKLSMRGAMALVALAGPASNIVIAAVCVGFIWLVFASGIVPNFSLSPTVRGFLIQMAFTNVGLAVFNMLPVPPLDGSRLMPRSLDGVMDFVGRYSFMFFMLIIFVGASWLRYPIYLILTLLFGIFGMDLGLLSALSR